MPTGSAGPLDGVKIIDLTTMIFGPLATMMLADLGADVVKVEPPEGDFMRHTGPKQNAAMSAIFLNVNRNKRSVRLDLKSEEGREVFMQLVSTADVVVHNMRQSAADRLGIGYENVRRYNQTIIYATGTGYSPASSQADRPAYDDVIQAASGIVDIYQRSLGQALYHPEVMADKLCAYVLANAISSALYCRKANGIGQKVVVPMYESLLAFNLTEHLWGQIFQPAKSDFGYPRVLAASHKPIATTDGHVAMLANSDDHWRSLFESVGRRDLVEDARFLTSSSRMTHITELYDLVHEFFASCSTGEALSILDRCDIPSGRVSTLEEIVAASDQDLHDFISVIEHPTEGPLRTVGIPTMFSETPARIRFLAPGLGEHTEEVLSSLAACSQSGAQH